MKIAIAKATIAVKRPTLTKDTSDADLLMYSLQISMVKMVAVEFSIDAKDETIAAARAANTTPFRPVGSN